MEIAYHQFEQYRIVDMSGAMCQFIISDPVNGHKFVVGAGHVPAPISEERCAYIDELHRQVTKKDHFDVIIFYAKGNKPNKKLVEKSVALNVADGHQAALAT